MPTTECETFIDLDYVKQYNQIADSDTTNDDQINLMLPGVSEGIRKYLKRGVCATTRTEVRNGRGTNFIRVWNPPVNSVTSVTYCHNGSNPVLVDGSNFVYESETGLVMLKETYPQQRIFEKGFQNTLIEYDGGWVDVPAPIKNAAAIIVKQLLLLADPNSLITSKRVGAVQISYANVIEGELDDPILAQAVTLLRPYRLVRY